MPAKSSLIQAMALLILPASLLFVSFANAQERDMLPEMPFPPRDMGVIWDMQQMSGMSNRSISMTTDASGVTTINASEDGVKTWIQDDPNRGITVKITRQYGPEQMDLLMEEQPELYMHLNSIPEETEDAEVEVTVGVTKTYEADDAEDLKQQHPEAFKLYEKYTSGDADIRAFGGRLEFAPPRLRVPELRVVPMFEGGGGMRIEIDPDRVRVHEDEDREVPEQTPRKEDKDT